jgi:glucuronosyltransferase
MGSIIQSSQWPEDKREAFTKVFQKLKLKVLWKYENDTLPDCPSNVRIGKWLPQRDILAHPNVKLFITHGGLLGTTEAITEGIPVLGIPIYADQRMNMNIAVGKDYGLTLDYNNITESSVSYYLNELLNNPKYRKNAKEISDLYLDRMATAKETTIYWVEYVIRRNGANHMKSAAIDLSFIERHLIDVYCVIALLIFMTFFILYRAIRFIVVSTFEQKGVKQKYS